MPHALITRASIGLGRAVAFELARRGWTLSIDARHADACQHRLGSVGTHHGARIPGDVADPAHREQLVAAVAEVGRLDLLINNASDLGGSPLTPA